MEKTSSALVKQVQEGVETAFDELFTSLYKGVYYTAYRICKSDDDAKEIAQQTFIQVHHSIKSLNDPNTFDVWLHRIIVNKCYNLFAKRKDVSVDPNTSSLLKNEAEYRDYLMPQSASRHQSDLEILNQMIDELPEKYRTLLILTYYCEYSMEEVAEIVNMPIGTVKSRLFTARSLLKKKVVEYEKLSGVELNFREVSPMLLIAAYWMAYQNLKLTIPLCPIFSATTNWLQHITKSGKITRGAMFSLSAAIGISVAGLVYAQITNNAVEQDMNPPYQYLEHEQAFQPVTLDHITYMTPYEAYYSLLVFAHCEVEMKAMTKEQLLHFKPLYDALKESNGSYYHQLQKIGWEDAYLALV